MNIVAARETNKIVHEICPIFLNDLIQRMEQTAYSLVHSSHNDAAHTLFWAVSDLEKVKL